MDPRIASLLSWRRPAALVAAFAALALAGCGHTSHPVQPVPLPPLRSVVLLTPDRDTIGIGAQLQMVAVGVDSATGDTLRGLALNWSSSDPSVATVSTTGLVTGVSEGNAKIVVSGSGKSDSAFVFVRPNGTGWIIVGNTQAIEDLHAVFFLPDGRTGWAVGNSGVVLRSSDAGATWTRLTTAQFNLMAVHFHGSTGFAVGAAGTVLKSTDLGAHWTPLNVQQAVGRVLRGVWMLDDTTAWVVGDAGTLFGTTDGGATWKTGSVLNSTIANLNAIAFSGADGWVVGETGTVIGTHDRGASWIRLPGNEVNTTNILTGVARIVQPAVLGASGAVAVGASGTVLRSATTTDSVAWVLGNAGASYQLNAVSFPAGQTVFAVGTNSGAGAILRSDDGGQTWTPQVPRTTSALNGVWFVDAYRGWAVGNGGVIRHTVTGGIQ